MQLYACIVDNSCYILLFITIFQSSLMITDDGLDLCNVPSLRLGSGLPLSFTTEVGTSDVTLLGTGTALLKNSALLTAGYLDVRLMMVNSEQ